MADSSTEYRNEIRHYPDQDAPTDVVYSGDFYAGADVYADRAITRARTRFKNESRFKDEEIPE
jgi:hypothetical protein